MKKREVVFLIICFFFGTNIVMANDGLETEYLLYKEYINKKYGFDYSLDVSVLGQHSSPSGKNNTVQSYLYPSFAWTVFDNNKGMGILNFAYTLIRYSNHNADNLAANSGFVSSFNDYSSNQDEFSELYFTYQPKNEWNWLTIGIGQFPIYNFDGTAYDANQQVNFLNDSLAQNASASYTQAGVGVYMQIVPNNEWSVAFGAQDATNINAPSIRFNHLDDKHYTTFGYLSYMPNIFKVGQSEVSVLLYNQPGVIEQPETTNGWSLNVSQNIGGKLSVFGRINGVDGHVESINKSWVVGGVYNNPLNRNTLDQIGVAYAYNRVDAKAVGENIYHKVEQIIETYWAWGIGKFLTITPDFQLYINPALNPKSDYGFVTSLRATVFF